MKLKRYLVANMKEALQLIRAELGPEALIIQTQVRKPKGLAKLWKKPQLEVLAAIEDDTERAKPAPRPVLPVEPVRKDNRLDTIEQRLETISRTLDTLATEREPKTAEKSPQIYYQRLQEQGLASELIQRLGTTTNPIILRQKLYDMLPVCAPLAIEEGKSNIFLFLGPTGVGKTTTLAKVAADFALRQGKKVAMATADTFRVAAIPQIETYATLLNVPIRVAYDPVELATVVDQFAKYDVVLVDMPGRSSNDNNGLQELEHYLAVLPGATTLLLLQSGLHLNNLRRITNAFHADQCQGVIFTKLDETEIYGPMFSIAVEMGKPIHYLTIGQNVPQDIQLASPERMVSLLMDGNGNTLREDNDNSGFVRINLREATQGNGAVEW